MVGMILALTSCVGAHGPDVVTVPASPSDSDAATVSASPSNSDLAAMVVQEHPRLFFDASELPTLQVRAATTHQDIWLPIRDFTDAQLGTSPPSSAPPDGTEDVYRNYANQLIPFAFACDSTQTFQSCMLSGASS